MSQEVQWNKLSPQEKYEARFKAWMDAEGVPFATPQARQAFQERAQMLKDVIELRKPKRIPVCPIVGFYPFAYAGITAKEAMYDYDKLGYALKKYHADFVPDSLSAAPIYGPGAIFELMDYKLYRWPGHGVPETTPYQCIEAEYMHADEYDEFLRDPSAFFMRKYFPRIMGALGAWEMLPPFTDVLELPFMGGFLVPWGIPPVQETLKKLLQAGQMAMEWIQKAVAIDMETLGTLGIPGLIGGFAKAPFDVLGDTLRGTRAIMLDMYRQPKKLLEALERITPMQIEMGVRSATGNKHLIVFIPLHKGADGFMSNKDFKTFYWPTLKALIIGLIEEGLVPYLFVEGGYNQRLDIFPDPDIPAGKSIWMFDQTDMKEVKKRFQGWACFGGNVPSSLLKAGTPKDVEEYVKRLIDEVGQDGGYILANGAVLDDAQAENLHALIQTGKEYGVYK
ncbi:MAG: uroporphyrinogen decarboxylase [Anaerolineae bacterium]|jgi:uroporphyrinogen-III decarboxylase|nr:MAG: uroporphyrinogen decarboxylase [Anaerolineae bacterium]